MPDPGVGTPPGTARRETRRQLRATHKRLDQLARDIARLEERHARLLAIRQEDPGLGARLDGLVPVLDFDRAAAHARAAIAHATIAETPASHAVVESLFPDDVYRAIVEAVPARAFFSGAGGGRLDLPVPPAVAPVDAVVTWRFVATLVREVIGPALVERLRAVLARHLVPGGTSVDELGLVASLGRLVWREPGYASPAKPPGQWDVLTTVVWLTGPAGAMAYGGEVGRQDESGAAVRVPWRPNSALVVPGPGGVVTHPPIPADVPEWRSYVSYEFPIGPDAAGRKALSRPEPPAPR